MWLTIAIAMYLLVPYDLDRNKILNDFGHGPRDGWDLAWMAPRFIVKCSVTMIYVSFW